MADFKHANNSNQQKTSYSMYQPNQPSNILPTIQISDQNSSIVQFARPLKSNITQSTPKRGNSYEQSQVVKPIITLHKKPYPNFFQDISPNPSSLIKANLNGSNKRNLCQQSENFQVFIPSFENSFDSNTSIINNLTPKKEMITASCQDKINLPTISPKDIKLQNHSRKEKSLANPILQAKYQKNKDYNYEQESEPPSSPLKKRLDSPTESIDPCRNRESSLSVMRVPKSRQSKTSVGLKSPSRVQNIQQSKSSLNPKSQISKRDDSLSFQSTAMPTGLLHNAQSKENILEDDYCPALHVLPQVSCKTYCIIDGLKGKKLYFKGDSEIREIASLTKIMTAIVSLQLAKELNLDVNATLFNVSDNAASTAGTTAFLKSGQKIKIIDLLHGLMLPSGNDAAVALAENFGEKLIQRGIKSSPNKQKEKLYDSPERLRESRGEQYRENDNLNPVKMFVKEMNKCTRQFHLRSTKYSNPHGLADKGNRSTANDIAVLAFNCLKDPLFASIVSRQKYECITYIKRKLIVTPAQMIQLQNREDLDEYLQEETPYRMQWFNSNKLLGIKGFRGVKTGITQTAGPCLCILYENEEQNHKLITVVLGCKNIDYRWRDARRLTLWADNMIIDQKQTAKALSKNIPLISQYQQQQQQQ